MFYLNPNVQQAINAISKREQHSLTELKMIFLSFVVAFELIFAQKHCENSCIDRSDIAFWVSDNDTVKNATRGDKWTEKVLKRQTRVQTRVLVPNRDTVCVSTL